MPSSTPRTRRQFVGTACGLLAGSIAGCADGASDDGDPAETTTENASTEPTATTEHGGTAEGEDDDGRTETGTAPDGDLDLREANVVAVGVEEERDGRYRFEVTLHHDDEGEEGYANWWQVETITGERMGRRDLAHPHPQQPFTRPTTIEVPDTVACVVVRGHDETHGYGGRAALLTLETDAHRFVDQGADPTSFTADDCP